MHSRQSVQTVSSILATNDGGFTTASTGHESTQQPHPVQVAGSMLSFEVTRALLSVGRWPAAPSTSLGASNRSPASFDVLGSRAGTHLARVLAHRSVRRYSAYATMARSAATARCALW